MTAPWRTSDLYSTGSPCMHALVIGISRYQHLPDNPGDPVHDGRITLGLGQATTPASSALRIAHWLETNYHNPEAPMGSIRLLLSPSELEIQNHDALSNLEPTILNTTAEKVKEALNAWRQDCMSSRNHVGIFYIAGHGIQLSKDDSIVLLEDFAKPNENVLAGAIDIGLVWRAMSNNQTAKTQFYFVDACRIKPEVFERYEKTPVGVTLDVLAEGSAEAAPIFFSAAPRSYALGDPGEGTLFCQALLDCLILHGVDIPDKYGRWTVTTSSLVKWLGDRVTNLALGFNESQEAVPGGLMKNVILHVLPNPPDVPVIISLEPDDASDYAIAKLQDGRTDAIIFEQEEFTPELRREVPGGKYKIHVTFPPNMDMYRARNNYPVFVLPPETKEEIKV